MLDYRPKLSRRRDPFTTRLATDQFILFSCRFSRFLLRVILQNKVFPDIFWSKGVRVIQVKEETPIRYAHAEIRTHVVVICDPTRYQLDHGGARAIHGRIRYFIMWMVTTYIIIVENLLELGLLFTDLEDWYKLSREWENFMLGQREAISSSQLHQYGLFIICEGMTWFYFQY